MKHTATNGLITTHVNLYPNNDVRSRPTCAIINAAVVKCQNIYRQHCIGGIGSRRNVGVVSSAAENISVFRYALKVVMVAELFVTGDSVPDSWCHDAECLGL